MIISFSQQFIYFKAYKVAGTSSLYALAQICQPGRDLYGAVKNLEGLRKLPGSEDSTRNHAFPDEIRDRLRALQGPALGDESWKQFKKVVNVRNPWDLAVSAYFWETQAATGWAARLRGHHSRPSIEKWYFEGPTRTSHCECGRDYLEENLRYYLAEDGAFIPTRFLRYEHLQEDLEEFCRELCVAPPTLPKLKQGHRNSESYRSCLGGSSMVGDIDRLYAPIIEQFRYSF